MTRTPYCGPVLPGDRGELVVAYKRAISRWRPLIYPWTDFTDFFGPAFVRAVEAFQRSHGRQATGRIGQGTHDELEQARRFQHPSEPVFDAVSAKILQRVWQAEQKPPEQVVRERIVAGARYFVMVRSMFDYDQYRPWMKLAMPLRRRVRSDCSGFSAACYEVGGAPDTNGRNYDHLGYTGTLIAHGLPTTRERLKLADLAFYGFTQNPKPGFPYGSPTHVVIVVDLDPLLVVSMGGQGDPSLLPLDYRGLNPRTPFRTYSVLP